VTKESHFLYSFLYSNSNYITPTIYPQLETICVGVEADRSGDTTSSCPPCQATQNPHPKQTYKQKQKQQQKPIVRRQGPNPSKPDQCEQRNKKPTTFTPPRPLLPPPPSFSLPPHHSVPPRNCHNYLHDVRLNRLTYGRGSGKRRARCVRRWVIDGAQSIVRANVDQDNSRGQASPFSFFLFWLQPYKWLLGPYGLAFLYVDPGPPVVRSTARSKTITR